MGIAWLIGVSVEVLRLLQKLFLVFLNIIRGVCHPPAFVFKILAFGVSLRASRPHAVLLFRRNIATRVGAGKKTALHSSERPAYEGAAARCDFPRV